MRNELRIGNLIYWVNQANPLSKTVIAVTPEMLISMPDKKDSPYQPIPLTEEWLLRSGFKRIGKDFVFNGLFIYKRMGGLKFGKRLYVDHVHQLMNLIYALTGTELAFKNQEEKI